MTEQSNAERELVSGMLGGEERAFSAFFDDYFPRIYRFALPRLGGNPDTCPSEDQHSTYRLSSVAWYCRCPRSSRFRSARPSWFTAGKA
jgi:hypothetical protein